MKFNRIDIDLMSIWCTISYWAGHFLVNSNLKSVPQPSWT